jgi:hypothetical protein
MPTIDERLRHVTSKVERSKKHVRDLQAEITGFFKAHPYRITAKRDPQTHRPTYYVASAEPVPDSIALIAGDALQTLMSALDHLAYQLVCVATNDAPPKPGQIYFPIRNTFKEYEAQKCRKMEGAHPDTISAIDNLKPYKGGNDLLWSMFALNNIEKHRLLFTVGSQAGGVHLSGALRLHDFIRNTLPEGADEAIAHFESANLWLVDSDKGFPLKAGFELFTDLPDAELNPKLKFRFEVALNEPGIVEGKPVVETLHQMTTLVEGIVTALTPRLK